MAQLWGLAAEPFEDPGRAVTIQNVGCVDFARDQVSAGVGDDMTPFGGALEPVAGDRLTP
jgi:hypothetical protein